MPPGRGPVAKPDPDKDRSHPDKADPQKGLEAGEPAEYDGLSKTDDLAGRGHGADRCQGKVLYRTKGVPDRAFRGGWVKRCGEDKTMRR